MCQPPFTLLVRLELHVHEYVTSKREEQKCHRCKDHLRNGILYNLFVELKEAFGMFETRRGKMSAKDLGPLLRCLGLNPSERDLEEARHELDVCGESLVNL